MPSILERYKQAVRPRLVDLLVRKSGMLQGALRRREGLIDRADQILLSLRYRELLHNKAPLPSFDDVGFRAYSQSDEDGILLYIFSLIGMESRRCIEICASEGIECNSANLIVQHGWEGLLFDGNPLSVDIGRRFFAANRDTNPWPPRFVQAWITAENVNDLIRDNGFAGEVDLLSIDVDGVDYWLWKAIDAIRPRVVVLEYLQVWGPDRAVTIPYKPDFTLTPMGYDYTGATPAAFVKLGREKGYRLVGSNRFCYNAFFVRDGVGEDVLPEVPTTVCFRHPRARAAMERLQYVKDAEWVEV